jgi:alcohol dehydrogenase class IV
MCVELSQWDSGINAFYLCSYAEYLAGMAFNSAGLGYVHAMSHQLGGFYDLPHGVCNAVLLPAVQVSIYLLGVGTFCVAQNRLTWFISFSRVGNSRPYLKQT